MTLSDLSDLAQIFGVFAVVASLIFVGVQLRQNTVQMQRAERNATNAEASIIRQAVFTDPDVAELVHACVNETRPLSPVEVDRLNLFLWEVGYLIIQFWDRTRYGLFQRKEEYEKIVQSLSPYFTSRFGLAWWRVARGVFRSDFVADLEQVIPTLASAALPEETSAAREAPLPRPEAETT